MKRATDLLWIALFGLGLGACASGPNAPQSAPAALSAVEVVPTNGLSPQVLPPGGCGLFLWGVSAPGAFSFFTQSNTQQALIYLDGEEVSLREAKLGGDIFGQFMTEQTYQSMQSGHVVNVSVEPGETISGGQRISSGRIVTTDPEGWETILPVLGVRACMPDQ